MMIDDIRLDANKQISPFNYSGHDVMIGRLGNTLLVNGQPHWGNGRVALLGCACARS